MAWIHQRCVVKAHKVVLRHFDGQVEVIESDIVFAFVKIDQFPPSAKAKIVSHQVTRAIDVAIYIVEVPAQHVEVRAVSVRGVMNPVTTARLMIGVET